MNPKILATLALLLTACSPHAPAIHGSSESTEVDDLLARFPSDARPGRSAYATQVMLAVREQMSDDEQYRGKSCTLHISLLRDGRLNSASVANGDEKFCAVALSAIKQADIPAAPDDETYQAFKNTSIDFKM
jgi:colicin import membrane protein